MALRQEQVVFAGAAALLAGMGFLMLTGDVSRRPPRVAQSDLEFEDFAAPDVSIALSNGRAMPLDRELFHPPRDTRPLPLLALVEPPRAPLAQLFPPSEPGPRASSFGALMRRALTRSEVLDLFSARDAGGDVGGASSTAELLAQAAASEVSTDHSDETPAENKARLDGYRRKYDWVLRGAGNAAYGQIVNENRFGLRLDAARLGEPLQFVEVIPETGEARFKSIGAQPVPTEWSKLSDFGFADSLSNELELSRASFQGELKRVDFSKALQLAERALQLRLEVPRALEIALEMNQMCIDYDPKDLRSQLGAIACLEAGFKFEEALGAYANLEASFGNQALVQVKLAQLDERFLSFEKARAGFEKGIALEPRSWQARLAYGEFLMRRGETAAALQQLISAQSAEPGSAEMLHQRVEIREALGDAYFASGDLEQAGRIYKSALAADESSQGAKAGLLAIGLYSAGTPARVDVDGEARGFELLLSLGLVALDKGDFAEARDLFMGALDADPLRSHRAYAALSCLAYLTGNEGQALTFIESALEVQPRDAYSLYWRGSLLLQQGDFDAAKSSLLAALDVELDFEDALVALGELAFGAGDFADAARFFERALGLNERRSEVHALAGMNYLRLGDVAAAEAAFDTSINLHADNAQAACGLAWCAYLAGDSTKARVMLSNLDDARRSLPEEDAWRVWAREQIVRIDDHGQKVEWTDNFNRQRLINGWEPDEGAGPSVSMLDGAVKIEGVFDKEGKTTIFRRYNSSSLVSLAIDVWIDPKTSSRVGVFVSREQRRSSSTTVIGEVQVGRHQDGSLQIRTVTTGRETSTVDMQQKVDLGRWVRFSIERAGDEDGTQFTVSMDGIPLIEGLDVPALKAGSATLFMGVTTEGKSGQEARVLVDEATVVFREG